MMNVFTAIEGAEYVSKRFAMKRFLGLSDEEIMENEKLWAEEKGTGDPEGQDGLKSVGASVPVVSLKVAVKQTLMKPMQMIQKKVHQLVVQKTPKTLILTNKYKYI